MFNKELKRDISLPLIHNSIISDKSSPKFQVKNFKLSYEEIQKLYNNIMSPLNRMYNQSQKEFQMKRTLPFGHSTSIGSIDNTTKKNIFSPNSQTLQASKSFFYLENQNINQSPTNNQLNNSSSIENNTNKTNQSVFFHNAQIFQKMKSKKHEKKQNLTSKGIFHSMKKLIELETRKIHNIKYYMNQQFNNSRRNKKQQEKKQRQLSCEGYSYYPSL